MSDELKPCPFCGSESAPYVMDRECLRCGAYADNATPLLRTETPC